MLLGRSDSLLSRHQKSRSLAGECKMTTQITCALGAEFFLYSSEMHFSPITSSKIYWRSHNDASSETSNFSCELVELIFLQAFLYLNVTHTISSFIIFFTTRQIKFSK